MKFLILFAVSSVTSLPLRRRMQSLPSFTASLPNVDSAIPVRRQNCSISRSRDSPPCISRLPLLPPRPEGVSMSSGDDTPVHGKKQILFCPLSSPNIGVGRIPPWTTVANVGGASVESPFVARRRNAKISQRGPFGRRARFREGGGGEMELYVWSWGCLFLYIGG